MKESNDKKWTIAEVLTNFGQRQSQVQQEKMIKQQLKDALMQNQASALGQFIPGMEQQMPPMNPEDASFDDYYQQAKHGGLHLDPRKKGTFKAQATRMGMSIQQAAAHILSNKEEYSPAMVKKANFARNFAKEEGGTIDNPGFNALPEYVQNQILNNMEYGGDFEVPEYGKGGYTVRRSNDRKGKTHVVTGPDGTKKYFGDPNMGERGNSKNGKDAFYARHATNLKNNPYFRAYARSTWEEGGEMMACPDGQYWDGRQCVEMPKQISDRNMNVNFTNPATYSVVGSDGSSIYDGSDNERAKGYYAVGSKYLTVPPEGSNVSSGNLINNLMQQSSDSMRKHNLEMMIRNGTNFDNLKSGTEKQRDGGETDPTIKCGKCGWSWKMSDAGSDPTTCHKCGSTNNEVEMKRGGMIKRADGSYSQRGLWDNIRANRGSGKEPTKEMLQQERKIKRKYLEGGESDCPENHEWSDELQTCVPTVPDTYGKDYLTDWYQRRPELVNDPNFGTLDESEAHGKWLNKVLPMINQRMETSNVPIQYTEMIDNNPDALGAYREATKKSNPIIEIAERIRQNPFENAQTQLHEYTNESTAGDAEKFVEPVHQRIANENMKSYEDFLETSPMADAVKNDKDLEEELYNDYMYSSGQTPEGKGNMHSYVMNWRNAFQMDPTKVYTEDDVESMISQAQQSGMFTKGSPNFSDDLYKLYRLSKDTKGLTNMFNLMANRSTPVKPDRLNDDIQYAKHGGSFGYMPDFF